MTWLRGLWLYLFHKPTDGRLDNCRCGKSWPCPLREKWIIDNDNKKEGK